MKNKYFKPTLFSDSDEDLVYNTFHLYVMWIIALIAWILDQQEWNLFTLIASAIVCILLYRMGYRLGQNCR